MDLFEVCRVAPDMIRVELREPAIVKRTIRAATVAETQTGGVFEKISVVSVTNANPAVFTLAKAVPWSNGTYVRFTGSPLGKTDLATSGYVTAVSGSTFQLYIHNGQDVMQLYNGAHGPSYVANSCSVTQLSTGTGSSRKYILGQNLDKVKDADYFPGPRGNAAAARDLSGYALTGKTLTFVGLQKDVWDSGATGLTSTTVGDTFVVSFAYFIYLKANSTIADGAYTLTFPAGLSTSPISFTLNDKTTRCCSMGINQIGHKPDDESKIGTLCQYVPQYTDYGSMKFLTDYSITDYHLINDAGTIVWSAGAAPVLRLGNQTAGNGEALDSISADPLVYGVAITAITRGATTQITAPGHGLVTNDKCSITGARGVWYQGGDQFYAATNYTVTRIDNDNFTVPYDSTGATNWISGGLVTKFYSVNYAGMHTYLLDFSTAVLAEGTYKLYIPGFGVSDPIYIDNAAWARTAQIAFKGLYHKALGMEKDGRFGKTHPAAAKVGVGGLTRILYTPIPHILWGEQAGGRLVECPAADRFLNGTIDDLWGGYQDAGDWDRVMEFYHLSELTQMMGPMCLVPKAARYTNANFPASKDTIATANYTHKYFCDWLDAAIWYLEPMRRTQAVDGGILSAVQFNCGLSNYPVRQAQQPTYETNTGWLAMAPSLAATVQYAYAAALLAWHLKEFGDTTLSNLYVASAELAYSYYNTIIALPHEADYHNDARLLYTEEPTTLVNAATLTFTPDPIGTPPLVSSNGTQWVASGFTGGWAVMNGNTYALRSSGNNFLVYDSTNTTAVDASGYGAYTPDTGKFTPTQAAFRTLWDVRAVAQGLTNSESTKDMAAAAGILYNMTGTAAYKTLHDANSNLVRDRLWGTYIYSLSAGATAAVVTSMYSSSVTGCTDQMLTYNGINDRSFTYFRNSGLMQEFGATNYPVYQYAAMAILCHWKAYQDRRNINGDTHAQAKANAGVSKYIKVLQDAYAFLLGANSLKMCWGIGHGQRSPCDMLNVDKKASGEPPAIGNYPYWITSPGAVNSNPNVYNFGETPLYDAGATTSGGVPNTDTELIPHRYARPRMASYVPIQALVTHTEDNLSKLYYLIGIALYLQYWEGSCVQADGKKRLIARAA